MEAMLLAMVLSGSCCDYNPAPPAEIPVITVEQGVEVKAASVRVVRGPVRVAVRVAVAPVRVLAFFRERQPVRNFFRKYQPVRNLFRGRPVRRVLGFVFGRRCR